MIGGGFCIENMPYEYEDEKGKRIVRRVWVVSVLGDENVVYLDDAVARHIEVQDRIWWRNNQTFWSKSSWQQQDAKREDGCIRVRRFGYPCSPFGSKLKKMV